MAGDCADNELAKGRNNNDKQNKDVEVIMIRRCSEPNEQVRRIYDAVKYKYAPYVKRKFVSTQI